MRTVAQNRSRRLAVYMIMEEHFAWYYESTSLPFLNRRFSYSVLSYPSILSHALVQCNLPLLSNLTLLWISVCTLFIQCSCSFKQFSCVAKKLVHYFLYQYLIFASHFRAKSNHSNSILWNMPEMLQGRLWLNAPTRHKKILEPFVASSNIESLESFVFLATNFHMARKS